MIKEINLVEELQKIIDSDKLLKPLRLDAGGRVGNPSVVYVFVNLSNSFIATPQEILGWEFMKIDLRHKIVNMLEEVRCIIDKNIERIKNA